MNYVKRHGNARVPANQSADDYKLGVRVVAQGVNYVKGFLRDDRRLRPEELPGWTLDRHTDQWEEDFARLLHYLGRRWQRRTKSSPS